MDGDSRTDEYRYSLQVRLESRHVARIGFMDVNNSP